MIGNAHIDPVWLWRWQEGFHEVKATFRSALDFMKEYPSFTFTASSAVFYEWIEQNDPEMFAEIRQRIQEGRWLLVGGMWIEPDCNIPAGESFVRQTLFAQRYFLEKFGCACQVGYNIDSFGHNGMLPQLLLKSGMPDYIFMRPSPHEKDLPGGLFWWEADDGSRVLTARLPFSYICEEPNLLEHTRRCAGELAPPIDESLCFYGVGDHGGGPTRAAIEKIMWLNADPASPAKLVFGDPVAFFQSVRAKGWDLPVVHDDLQHHASGCYAAHSGVKRWNRQAENRLLMAEKWAALASQVTGQPYPQDFGRAWKNVLFNQFHDILAGTSLETAYDDVRDTYGEARAIADRALNLAVQSFAWQINIPTEEGMRPIVAFNPNTWPVKAIVEVDFDRWMDGSILVDEDSQTIPFQGDDSPTTPWRRRLSFLAELPALGYRTYRFIPPPPHPNPLPSGEGRGEGSGEEVAFFLENDRFQLQFSALGSFSLFDKEMKSSGLFWSRSDSGCHQ